MHYNLHLLWSILSLITSIFFLVIPNIVPPLCWDLYIPLT